MKAQQRAAEERRVRLIKKGVDLIGVRKRKVEKQVLRFQLEPRLRIHRHREIDGTAGNAGRMSADSRT
jgi:hypothetical protein